MPTPNTSARRAALAAMIALTAVLFVLVRSSATADAQATSTTAPVESTTSTTFDPTSETAPVLEIKPNDSPSPASSDGSESSTGTGQKLVIFAAAVLLPLAGVAFLVWYARRAVRVAATRADAHATATAPTNDLGELGDEADSEADLTRDDEDT